MAKLVDNPTVSQVKNFLFDVSDYANNKPCKGNRSLTKKQFWNMYMKMVVKEDDETKQFTKGSISSNLVAKNLNREFSHN